MGLRGKQGEKSAVSAVIGYRAPPRRFRRVAGLLSLGFIAYPAVASFGPPSIPGPFDWVPGKIAAPVGEADSKALSGKRDGRSVRSAKHELGVSASDPRPLIGEVRFAAKTVPPPTKKFSLGGKHGRVIKQAARSSNPGLNARGSPVIDAPPLSKGISLGQDQSLRPAGKLSGSVESAHPLYGASQTVEKQQDAKGGASPATFAAKVEYKNFGVGQAKLNGGFLGFPLPGQRWELNDVKELRMEVSSKDDWVKFSIRESKSSYQANPTYLFNVAGRNPFGDYVNDKTAQSKVRFLFNNQPIGVAGTERIDVKVIDSELFKFSGFAFHSQTGDAFYSDATRRNPNDDFSVANRQSVGFGEKIAVGPISLTSKFKRIERVIGANAPTERSQDHTISLDLEDARRRLGVQNTVLSTLAPSSVYGGIFSKTTIFKTFTEGPPDQTKGVSAGAHWGWNNGALDVSYFKYFLNSHRTGDQNYDSAGRGINASLSAWTDRLVISAGLSLTQSDYLPANASNVSRFVNAYASSTFKLDTVPDVFVDVAGWRSDYLDQSGRYEKTSWSSSIGLDLSKYLPLLSRGEHATPASSPNFSSASLRTMYRYQSGMDYFMPGQGSPTGHFFGLSFRTALN